MLSCLTANKMQPDGFGGMVVRITSQAIRSKSTNDILEDYRREVGRDRPATFCKPAVNDGHP
jgi:hypothetical protein